jgi:ATP-dependent RNA helicase DDX5/DBP2
VHRIGRTARAGATGRAWTLFTDKNARSARALVDILREADQPVPPELARLVGRGGGGGGSFRSRGYGGGGGGYGGGYGGGGVTGANALPLGSGARRSPPSPW